MWEASSCLYVGGGAKLKNDDRDVIHSFLENQSSTYTCGIELASSMKFSDSTLGKKKVDKRSYRPFIPTYVGNLALCCMHPVEGKVSSIIINQHAMFVKMILKNRQL